MMQKCSLTRDDAKMWFEEVIPGLAVLLLWLPSLLEVHYHKSHELIGNDKCQLSILSSQNAGIVILNQVNYYLIFFLFVFSPSSVVQRG